MKKAKKQIQEVDSKAKQPQRQIWLFQANPLRYEVYSSLNDENLKEAAWLVNRYKDDIHVGDTGLIWKARQRSGIYAVGDITSDPEVIYDLEESQKYWKYESGRNKKALRAKIHYNLRLKLTNALLSKELRAIHGLSNMEIFRQPEATNFRVKPLEWEIIRDLLKKRYNFEG
jgi:hypothetical protein